MDDLQLEIRRALEWIHHDRKEYSAQEVRRGWERLAEARLQLQQAMTYRRMADRQPSCIDEKRALEAAKRRLQVAQEKVEAVRHWSQAIERAVNEYHGGCTQFTSWLEGDLPKALAALDRMTEALESYVAMATSEESAAPEETVEAAAPPAVSRIGRSTRPGGRPAARCHGADSMKTWDLTAGAARLELALQVAASNQPGGVRVLARRHQPPLSGDLHRCPWSRELRTLLDGLGRLAQVLSAAEHQCRDPEP